jgi:folylpolyglutamate synthase
MRAYLRRMGLDPNDGVEGGDDRDDDYDDRPFEDDGDDDDDGDGGGGYVVPPLIFHVAGTKGKGSTLAMAESLLRNAYGLCTGTFTSPHLVDVRERIRIDGRPISRRDFGEAYWEVRRRLEEGRAEEEGEKGEEKGEKGDVDVPALPGYFRMLALVALHVFCSPLSHRRGQAEEGEGGNNEEDGGPRRRGGRGRRIDVMLLEVGMGGRYDATNLFEPEDCEAPRLEHRSLRRYRHRRPGRLLVRGVTLIDYDHVRVLGKTLEGIAWEKGGIYVVGKGAKIGNDDGGYEAFVVATGRPTTEEEGEDEGEEEERPIVFASGTNTPGVLAVLEGIARENGSRLAVVRDDDRRHDDHDGRDNEFPPGSGGGLLGDHQRGNAALALAMCRHAASARPDLLTVRSRMRPGEDEDGVLRRALAATLWPGRCHTVHLSGPAMREGGRPRSSITLRLDGAHTPISMDACARWFRGVSTTSTADNNGEGGRRQTVVRRVLVFHCGHERNPIPLLFGLRRSGVAFDSVYFCRPDSDRPSAAPYALEDGWTREALPLDDDPSHGASGGGGGPRAVVGDGDGDEGGACGDAGGAKVKRTTVTWEGMRDSMSGVAAGDGDVTDLRRAVRGEVDAGPPSPPAAEATTWQETLGCLWRVMDAYLRRVDDGGGGAGNGARSPSPVTTGLSVGGALASIREEAACWAEAIDDSDAVGGDSPVDDAGGERGLSVEVCVTGSLYIVGSALAAAGWEEGDG